MRARLYIDDTRQRPNNSRWRMLLGRGWIGYQFKTMRPEATGR